MTYEQWWDEQFDRDGLLETMDGLFERMDRILPDDARAKELFETWRHGLAFAVRLREPLPKIQTDAIQAALNSLVARFGELGITHLL